VISKRIQKLLQRQCDQLNGIIHSRNLYTGGKRYINAHLGINCAGVPAVMVENLYTGETIAFHDFIFVDGHGSQVNLD